MEPDAPLTPADVEPLGRLARLSWDRAPLLCDPAHGCADYHRSWSMLRLVRSGGRPPAGWAFFHAEIARAAHRGARRVLIAGGADAGLLAVVASGFRNAGVGPEITFVDRCATPVAQNRLLGDRLGLALRVETADLRDFRTPGMDLVIAHSVLVFLETAERARVIANWAESLAPGGAVLMSSALADDGPGALWRPASADDVPARKARLQAQARGAGLTPAEAAELADVAARVWATRPSDRTGGLTEAELRGHFQAAGLAVERIACKPRAAAPAPGAPRQRRRAEIVARAPD